MSMKAILRRNGIGICAGLALAGVTGCSWPPTAPLPGKNQAAAAGPIVTPNFSLAAKVISVNTVGRFVVLSFPAGGLPKLDQTLFLYRDGLKTAEVHISGPQQENNIVADLTAGDAQVGDSVSDK
jgi:hypothetical protein